MTQFSKRLLGTVMFAVLGASAFSAQNSPLVLDQILEAHHAPKLPSISVEMTGRVERNGKSEPVRIFATRDEELRIDYGVEGKDTLVLSQKQNFRDDGKKITYQKDPSGFSQLDITGLFLVEQLRNRAVRVEPAVEGLTIGGTPTKRIRIQSERTQKHKGSIQVDDRLDLYVTATGGLAGIARSFYEGRPERYTQAISFLDYRETPDGSFWPYRIEVYLKSKRVQTFSIDKYEFNKPADRETFISRRVR